ncbi:MAG TPA: DUF4346 domain-containing protein [Candidatus Nanoarchaeia archaeon]|nr:DUF4346 domain-containing protein [Candidatus Nanoarchaeia archaeon]
MERPAWVKDKKVDKDFEVIRVKKWDDYKDFKMDNGCYLLIRNYFDTHEIGIAVCDYQHTILKEFRGTRAQDLYFAIFDFDEKNKKGWFNRMDHAAYLGKELKKAEICLAMGIEYVQE